MGYNYAIDSTGRAVQPVQSVAYQSESQMMQYAPRASPQHDYHPQHNGQSLQPAPTVTYAQYPNTVQAYLPPSPHEIDHHVQMMQQRSPMDQQAQMMYGMPQGLKAEH